MSSENLYFNRFRKQLLLAILVLQSAFIFAQDITISSATSGLSSSPLTGGLTDQAILGIQFDKAGGGTNSITGVTVLLNQNPTGRFQNARLCRSDDGNSFTAADLSNVVATGTFSTSPNSIVFSGTFTNFSNNAGATTRYLFLVVDIDPIVTNSTSAVTPSLSNANVSVANNTVIAATITGSSYSFADTTTPTLTFNPANGATNVTVSSNLIISFDEAIRNINDSDIDNANVGSLLTLKLTNAAGADVPFTATINAGNDQITIDPTSNLNSDQLYYLSINPVEDASNNATSATSITFTTVDTQPPVPTFNPLNGAVGVIETNNIVISFNEAIRRASDDANLTNTSIDGRITLKLTNAAGADIPFDATINAGDDQVTIDPTSALPGNTIIYVAIAGVEDSNNNLISPDPASITFTTGDTQSPTLTFNPANSATNVSVSANLTITFNEAIRKIDNSAISAANLLTLVDFKLTNAGGADVSFTASIDGTNTIVTIDPSSNLTANQVYFLRMNPVEDAVNNATSAQSITFTSENGPTFSGGPFTPSTTCVGDNIVISGNNFGAAVPTVTVNGTSTTAGDIVAHTNTSITFKTLTGMVGNSLTVTVMNNTNGLSSTSVSTVTIRPAIALSLPLSSNPPSPVVGGNYDIEIANTQSNVNYAIRELPGGFAGSTPGTGTASPIGLETYNKPADGTFQYEVRATSSGCTQRIYGPLSVTIAALSANAGTDKMICVGDSVILGGSPTASGGTGFYNISWNTVPPTSNFSNDSNPLVKPTSTTTYRVTLKDSPAGTPKTDDITITVNPKPTVAFDPTTPTNFNVDQAPYKLGAVVLPANGSGVFTGTGVVQHSDNFYYFHPDLAGIQNGVPITYTHTNTNGCSRSVTILVNVLNNQSPVLNLKTLYCSNETPSGPALAPNPVVVNMTWYRKMRFLDSNQIPVSEADPNYPLNEVPASNPKAYTFDPIKAAAILGASGKFYIGVYGDISIPPFINIVDILISIDVSSISFPGIIPTIQGVTTGSLLCKDASPIILTASTDGNGYNTINYSVVDFYTEIAVAPNPISQPTPGQYVYTPNTVTYPSNEAYRFLKIIYDYTDQNGCTGKTDNYYFYNIRKPDAPIANDQQYCQFYDAGKLTLSATGEFRDFLWYENSNLSDASPGRGSIFDTGLNSFNPVSKTFYVTDNFAGCVSNPTSVIIQVTPVPSINLSIPPQCENRIGTFNGPSGNIVSYTWDLGDGTSANTQTVQHTYDKEGAYDVALRVVFNSNGQACPAADTVQVTVGRNPKPVFSFNQLCDGDITQFVADANIPVQKFEWNFGDGDIISAGNSNNSILPPNNNSGRSGGTYQNPTHRYLGGPQSDSVTVKAYTSLGCFDSTRAKLTILPLLSFSSANPYIMKNLDSEMGFWSIEDVKGNSTWEFAQPNNTILKANESAWVTNADGNYLPNDLSYVNSPCFNISSVTKPVLTLDYLSNTPRGSDGAVLQYSTNGTVWSNLGSIGSGKNWFNEVGIPFGGGNNQGWSGDLFEADSSWTEGKRILDDISPRNKIRFRIAFYSSQEGELEGFAFKNVRIEPRNRQLLVENFTNIQAPQASANNGAFYGLPTAEIVKLEYHTSFPSDDPLNEISSEDHNSRAAFYGLTNSTGNIPSVYLDGESSGNLVPSQNAWFFNRSLFRALDSSPYGITVGTLPNSADEFIVSVSVKANQIVIGKPIVHVAIIEKNVGAYQSVVRKLLPNAAGTPIPTGILSTPDSTFSMIQDWKVSKISDLNEMAVVVFVQDEITKEVYQAEYLENPTNLPSVITGIEPLLSDQIAVYPNPAKDEVNIKLPRSFTQTLPIKMIDAFGREVYSASFSIGEQTKTLKTSEFSAGVYIIQIKSASGVMVMKKVIINN